MLCSPINHHSDQQHMKASCLLEMYFGIPPKDCRGEGTSVARSGRSGRLLITMLMRGRNRQSVHVVPICPNMCADHPLLHCLQADQAQCRPAIDSVHIDSEDLRHAPRETQQPFDAPVVDRTNRASAGFDIRSHAPESSRIPVLMITEAVADRSGRRNAMLLVFEKGRDASFLGKYHLPRTCCRSSVFEMTYRCLNTRLSISRDRCMLQPTILRFEQYVNTGLDLCSANLATTVVAEVRCLCRCQGPVSSTFQIGRVFALAVSRV